MITPRVHFVRGARADFEELLLDDELDLHWRDHAHAKVLLYAAPDKTVVVAFYYGHPMTVADVPRMASEFGLTDQVHWIVSAPEFEEGFAEALDEALAGKALITLSEPAPVRPEVAAVPMPEPAPPVTVPMTITERDFNFLVGTSFGFDFEHFKNVLETYDPDKPGPMADVDSHWKMAYVLDGEGVTYADVMLATAFLKGNGHAFELASAPSPDEDKGTEWWILTDFKTASWRRSDEMDEVKKRLEREAAAASGDELAQMYHAPSASKEEEEQGSGE